MSEPRIVDANRFDPFDICDKARIDIAATLRGWVALQPTIDPETLPIVQELKAKLARYEQAENEGRLVIVPDKLYDLLYDEAAPEKSYIAEYNTEGVGIKFAGDYIQPDEIGKTIFLTREEAKAELKESVEPQKGVRRSK